MLTRSFIHLPGIGEKNEILLKKQGIFFWNDLLQRIDDLKTPVINKQEVKKMLELSQKNLEEGKIRFFAEHFNFSDLWRIYPDFSEKAYFLDVETDGLSLYHNEITIISVYHGNRAHCYVQGINLEDFRKDMKKLEFVVTFNGANFDFPFIRRLFPGFRPKAHLDLRFLLQKLGFSGGLKSIEEKLSVSRDKNASGLSGKDAIDLWHKYISGDISALATLVRYNISDAVNLKPLAEIAYGLAFNRFISADEVYNPYSHEEIQIPEVEIRKTGNRKKLFLWN